MSPELSKRLAAAVDSMPAFPKSVQRVLELSRNLDASAKELVDVIDKDPVITVRILKVVNSAYYSLPKQITSVGHAVVYMGFNTIKNLALGIAAIGMLPKSSEAGFDGQQYLLHSLTTAAIAKLLAARLRGIDATDAFIAGLLHDFGKVVLALNLPHEFRAALQMSQTTGRSLHLTLREVLGADHAVVGAMLVEKWRFAPHVVDAIGNQYGPELGDSDFIACVFGANQISKQLGFGFAGNPWVDAFPPAVAQRLGGSREEVIESLGDLSALLAEAQTFARM